MAILGCHPNPIRVRRKRLEASFHKGIIYIVTDHFAFGQFEAQKKPRFAPHRGQTDLMLLRAILRATAAAFSPVPAG